MIITLKKQHDLQELINTGCQVRYSLEHCRFPMGKIGVPTEIHLLPIPEDWDCDDTSWAPPGFESLQLSALIAVGIEYPELQKQMTITATGAVDDCSEVSFPGYAYLGVDEKGKSVIGIDGIGFVPFCLRNSKGNEFRLVGIFRKIEHDCGL
ncbi:MAG: hypothetical protein WCP09_03995 [Candidatus Taylorbacteria bacterium]